MDYIRRFWFGSLISFIVCCFFILFILLIISPKQDVKERGFIKCTQQMIDNISNCDRGFWCSIKAIGNNTLCDINVVFDGLKLWLNKEQPRPWSNYIFEPELEENSFFDKEAREEYLKNNPDIKGEMKRLEKLRKDLEDEENKQQEITEEMLPKQ